MKFNLKLILLSKLLLLMNIGIFVSTGFVCLKDRSEPKGKKLSELNEEVSVTNPMLNWNENYEKTIEFVKKHEGFAEGKPYICPGGYKTIGYGHVIVEGENFEQLTEKQADSLLRADFNKAIKAVERTIQLPSTQKLAIAHFVYTKGIGSFINSGLKEKIEKGESIDSHLLEMCYYTNKEGKRIKSQNALNIRKWEIDLYNLKS
jgi:lysozyme